MVVYCWNAVLNQNTLSVYEMKNNNCCLFERIFKVSWMASSGWLFKMVKYWFNDFSWHHQSKSKEEQNDACCTFAMTTVLLLVLSKYKLKFPVFFSRIIYSKNLLRSLLTEWKLRLLPAGLSVPPLRVWNWDICFLAEKDWDQAGCRGNQNCRFHFVCYFICISWA